MLRTKREERHLLMLAAVLVVVLLAGCGKSKDEVALAPGAGVGTESPHIKTAP